MSHALVERLRGVIPPLVTPFTADGSLDLPGFERNLERYADEPLAGYLVLGSNGEASTLELDEKLSLVRSARARAGKRLLLAGTGLESTRATLDLTRRAADAGADAALVVTPHYYKAQITPDALARHFEAVADGSPIPILLYSVPAYTAFPIPLSVAVRLAAHPNVAGMKESAGDLGFLARVQLEVPELAVCSGSAPAFYPALCAGAVGGILAVACVVPFLAHEVYRAFTTGDHQNARRLHRALVPLASAVTSVYGVAGLKRAMDLAGLTGGLPRAPLPPAPESATAELQRLLDQARSARAAS